MAAGLNSGFQDLYDRRLAALPFEVDTLHVTAAGFATCIHFAGPRDAPPLLALPGIHFTGPFNLALYSSLVSGFRVVSPDPPGQLGRSDAHVPRGKAAWGAWAAAVLDAAHAEAARVVGISFGGAVALALAAHVPQRLIRLALIAPVGLARIPWIPVLAMTLRALHYRRAPSARRLAVLAAMLCDDADEDLLELLAAVAQTPGVALAVPPGPFSARDLSGFAAPTLLVTGTRDLVAPAREVEVRARLALRSLTDVLPLDARHIPSPRMRSMIESRVGAFFEAA